MSVYNYYLVPVHQILHCRLCVKLPSWLWSYMIYVPRANMQSYLRNWSLSSPMICPTWDTEITMPWIRTRQFWPGVSVFEPVVLYVLHGDIKIQIWYWSLDWFTKNLNTCLFLYYLVYLVYAINLLHFEIIMLPPQLEGPLYCLFSFALNMTNVSERLLICYSRAELVSLWSSDYHIDKKIQNNCFLINFCVWNIGLLMQGLTLGDVTSFMASMWTSMRPKVVLNCQRKILTCHYNK